MQLKPAIVKDVNACRLISMAGFPHLAVVDDEEAIVDILGYTLQKKFPESKITGFNDSNDAQSWLAGNSVDLLLTDLNMPELNGKDIISMMDQKHPHTPVIVISGAIALNELKVLETQFKNVRVFAKPLLTRDLIKGIEEGLALEGAVPQERIQQLSLASMVHLFHLQGKSLQLAIQSDDLRGSIVLRDGELVLAEIDEEQSEEAFFDLLDLKDPEVKVEYSQYAGEAITTKSFEQLYREFASLSSQDL